MSVLSLPDRAQWYAAQIKRTAFRTAEQGLMRQGYGVFVPTVEHLVSRFGKRRPERKLMFPGYLFVAINPDRPNWRAITNTVGVSRLVMRTPSVPAPLPQEFISALRARCDADGCLRSAESFEPGVRVNIISGPFAGFVSTIERIDEARRVWILLDILGGSRTMRVDASQLRVAV